MTKCFWSVILIPVMRDNIACEEVFEQQSDAWVANVTVANGFDNVETEEADEEPEEPED